jgi:GNAT superfamily N-acetyltransferase
MTAPEATADLTIVPANEASWDDLQAVYGTRGSAAGCQCQRYKLRPREAFAKFPAEERAFRLREQTNPGDPAATTTTGLLAYRDGEPVGWCAVEPRSSYHGLRRNNRVPWEGRDEDKTDASVWAVTCLFTRAGFRGQGISYALARAAVDFAQRRGARAVEGYPMLTKEGQKIS